MKDLINILENELRQAFRAAGYDESYAKVVVSNRPDLCEYQCNGAMAAAKQYHKAPIMIAKDVLAALSERENTSECSVFDKAEAVNPGFINLDAAPAFLASHLNGMAEDPRCGIPQAEKPKKIILDYGGPNVAKPLHVGHLRSAIIGECLKRLGRALGNEVIGDVHLGDWGLQMGLLITEMQERHPDLPYFDDAFEGEYPAEAPFTISELEEMYPAASARSKEDEEYRARALEATHSLQEGKRGYHALWKKIVEVSVADLKKNYEKLDVHFDLWKSESDAQPYIPDMVKKLKEEGYAHYDQGALIVDVAEESDTKEIPPCIILKSDGASLYSTTDLATIVERRKLFNPDELIYLTDKRQEMHFIQVFRTARKAGIAAPDTVMRHLGFGTMNGKDGKPFKTREGGVMRLEYLIRDINEEMEKKILENRNVREEDARETAEIVGLAALKYGDLSNQASKDYIFDVEKFTSFEGNTGPYILYTIVRIKSILERYGKEHPDAADGTILPAAGAAEKKLMLAMTGFGDVLTGAFAELMPHRICQFIYELANAFNSFYHETKILTEEDPAKQASWIALLKLVKRIMEEGIEILGFGAPEHM
ncbi:MAG: arginine--tRNA ligase [Lachnospiraceae bacterium]|nr:arginine--tRNA ligase [Lachnospiraceae bacterium]